jgi:hypothetical protein
VTAVANPYANLPLRIPEREWESVRRFTTTFRPEDGSEPNIDQSPFNRYVDLWWAALIVGVREGRRSKLSKPSDWHDFTPAVVFNQDPWRIRELELLALAETGGTDVLDDPGQVIAIATEYAATGIGILIDRMTGQTEPIWAVTSLFRSLAELDLGGGTST